MRVRQALLGDAEAISAIYCSHVELWRHQDNEQHDTHYADLSLYERWQHGGPWLSVETCAVWLGHLLQSNESIPLVAEDNGEVLAHAEVFLSDEADPYGLHMNISTLCVHSNAQRAGGGRALVSYVEEMAQVLACKQVTVAYPTVPEFYEAVGFEASMARQQVNLPVEEGRVFYKAREMEHPTPDLIAGWHMPLGRFQNAREEWEQLHWTIWNGVPQLAQSDWHRLHIDLTGQPAILHLHQHDDDPSAATLRLWTKNPPSGHVISAARDRASRLGYSRITSIVDSDTRPLLTDAEEIGKVQWLYAKKRA